MTSGYSNLVETVYLSYRTRVRILTQIHTPMRQNSFFFTVFGLLVIILSCSPQLEQSLQENPALSTTHSALFKIDTIAQKLFDKEDFPGMAVMVWQEGNYVFEKGYGYADIEKQILVDPRKSLFRIGSVSKPVTAALLAKLYENGMPLFSP